MKKLPVRTLLIKSAITGAHSINILKTCNDVLEHIEDSLIPTLDELPPITIGSNMRGMPMNTFLELYEKNSKYYTVLLGDGGDSAFASKLKKQLNQ
ncbi:MAG: hypothetical protein Q8O06_11565 [Acetobacterium sp.]|nr:hypothetical protein [Acetobacterium sp.]